MPREQKNMIEYVTMCIFLFASRFRMSVVDAIAYLIDYGGVSFLEEYYEIEHTLPIDDTIGSTPDNLREERRRQRMILYHGSNVGIERIDLTRCRPFKDFGR